MQRKWDPILKAAKLLFLEKGIAATSMDEVAARAGATKRTVYNNFGSKERLLAAVFAEADAGMRDTAPALAADAGPDGLRKFATDVMFALVHDYAIGFQRVIVAEGRQYPHLVGPLVSSTFAALSAPLAAWLAAHGRDPGDAHAAIDGLTSAARLHRLMGLRPPYAEDDSARLDSADQQAVERFVSSLSG
jgi:AcrR family transcriptional regulator